MRISSLLSQSFRSIWNNKARSGLTILGIVIGIASVISLVALGNGLQSGVTSRLTDLGTERITVSAQDPERETATRQAPGGGGGAPSGGPGGFMFGGTSAETLTQEDYETVRTHADIALASPELRTQLDVALESDAETATAFQVSGVDVDYLALQELTVQAGEFITSAQVTDADSAVVLGADAAADLFADLESEEVLGKKLYIGGQEFTVTGVLASTTEDEEGEGEEGESGPGGGGGFAAPFNTTDGGVLVPYTTWLTLNEKELMSSIIADATDENLVSNTADELETTLLTAHAIDDLEQADVAVTTNEDLLSTVSSVTSSFTNTLTGIAAISLLVGGIGIMNIMLVTVTERTREVGLRKAVGATRAEILIQFLVESVMLTLLGGVLGLLLGIVLSQNIGSILTLGPIGRGPGGGSELQAVVDVQTVIIAIVVSMLVGVIFGLFPAIKASKLDPVEALRYE